jgi:chromosome segregation ATPase
MAMPSREEMVRRYYELCDRRDAAYEEADPLEKKLDAANAKVMAAQAEASALAEQIEETWAAASDDGTREGWLALKKEIADIAAFLRKIPPRPAEKADEA